MKKIFLFSLMVLTVMSSAQIIVNANFKNINNPDFVLSGGVAGGTYTKGPCNIAAIGANVSGSPLSTVQERTINLIYTKPTNVTANGKKIGISFIYTAQPSSPTASYVGGVINVEYSTDGGTTYIPVSSPVILQPAQGIACATYTGTIPEGANVTGNFMLRIQTVATIDSVYNFYSLIEKVSITQEATIPPTCTTIISPANGATGITVRHKITWEPTALAESYKVKIGTTPGSSDIHSETTSETYYIPTQTSLFPQNKTLYVSIIPTNSKGDATECQETSFTTGNNSFLPYCGPLAARYITYPISNVIMNNIVNISSPVINIEGHENFTNKIVNVEKGASFFIKVTGTGLGVPKRFNATVFIDWNQNGSFNDIGENYFTSFTAVSGTGNPVIINLPVMVPSTASFGHKRMRIKYGLNDAPPSSYPPINLTNPCEDIFQGQVEDYTINVVQSLGTSDINADKKTDISVYPSPFKDILKISDIKDVKSIAVTDVSGRQIKMLKPSTELNLSDLNSGLYLISLHMEDGSIKTVKAIKK